MIGRSPTGTIGLGSDSVCSRSLIPIPPQKRTTFISAGSSQSDNGCPTNERPKPPSGIHPDLWNRHNELAAPVANVRKLRDDFFLQVPGQNQHVIGTRLPDPIRRKDRDVRACKELSMLVRIPIDRVVEKIGPDAAVIQQRIAFAWRSVASHRLPLAFDTDQ